MLKLALFLSCGCVLVDPAPVAMIGATPVPSAITGTWLAQDIDGRGVIDDLQTTLEINDDGTYAGFAGCNSYTGMFSLKGSEIRFGPAGTTRQSCSPAVMDQESKFFAALDLGAVWTVDASIFTLEKADATLAVEFVAKDR